eukprot:CAMPEP_0115101372 /NCGR_PEP_ID=MMETSP0227-20121206/33183_1 /TAXON_ID=89957 /ORGANISM="Polarella glacialis, Strain CCMP 1383" /LENGTH=184 /DNA_ID=CAMNT_0002497091 /DNA_START=241 /DNA_END=794 /DNA_ORIENTATION=-
MSDANDHAVFDKFCAPKKPLFAAIRCWAQKEIACIKGGSETPIVAKDQTKFEMFCPSNSAIIGAATAEIASMIGPPGFQRSLATAQTELQSCLAVASEPVPTASLGAAEGLDHALQRPSRQQLGGLTLLHGGLAIYRAGQSVQRGRRIGMTEPVAMSVPEPHDIRSKYKPADLIVELAIEPLSL